MLQMNNKLIVNEKNILFYNDEDGNIQVEVFLKMRMFG